MNRILSTTLKCLPLVLLAVLGSGAYPMHSGTRQIRTPAGGDIYRGKELIAEYGCGACHTIPGVGEARGLVGPPLTSMGSRVYVAGIMKNTPDNLIRWIVDPPAADPLTAMPNMHVTPDQARDIASYLYTLQ